MRLLLSVALVALVLLVGCNKEQKPVAGTSTPTSASATPPSKTTSASPATAQVPTVHADGVRRITTVELHDLMAKNQVVVVDVRTDASFKQGHIPGAKLIPVADILQKTDQLPKDKLIVTYCSWPNEHTSAGAVVNMKTKGIQNAAALLGGFDAWKNAGYPVDTTK